MQDWVGFEADGCGAWIYIFLSDEQLLQICVPLPRISTKAMFACVEIQLQSLGLDKRLNDSMTGGVGLLKREIERVR